MNKLLSKFPSRIRKNQEVHKNNLLADSLDRLRRGFFDPDLYSCHPTKYRPSKAKRKARRKAQRLARRLNR